MDEFVKLGGLMIQFGEFLVVLLAFILQIIIVTKKTK